MIDIYYDPLTQQQVRVPRGAPIPDGFVPVQIAGSESQQSVSASTPGDTARLANNGISLADAGNRLGGSLDSAASQLNDYLFAGNTPATTSTAAPVGYEATAEALPELFGVDTAASAIPQTAGAPTGFSAAGALSNLGSMGIGPQLGIAGGTKLLYDGAKRAIDGNVTSLEDFDDDPYGGASRAQLAFTTGGLSEIANLAGINFGSGKGKDQRERDSYRSILQQAGIADKDYNVTLSDGKKVNVGYDRDQFNTPGGKSYFIDWDSGVDNQLIADLDPLAHALTGGKGRREQQVGMLYNTVKKSSDPYGEVRKLYNSVFNAGGTPDGIQSSIQNSDRLSDEEKRIFSQNASRYS